MKNNKGFTLVELIVVILIMAVLAAIAFPVLLGYVSDALNAKYIQQAQSIYSVLQVEQARYAIDNKLENAQMTYQDKTANASIIANVNDQLDSELNLNSLLYYSEANSYHDEDVPANSFLFDFTALDGSAKVALVKVNKQVVIFDGANPVATYLDPTDIIKMYTDNKADPVDKNSTTKNFREFVLANSQYQDVTAAEKDLISSEEDLYWVPVVSQDTNTVYFAAYGSNDVKAGDIQSSMVCINGVYYVHYRNDNTVGDATVSHKGTDYELLGSITGVGSTVACTPASQGYWKIVK